MRKKATTLVLIILGSLLMATSSRAYVLMGVDWNWLGGSPITVDFYINPNCADPTAPDELSSCQSALGTWSAAGANFAYNYAGATSSVGFNQDGQNQMNWSNGGGGALATTSTWSSGGDISEADVVLWDEWTWSTSTPTSDQFDVESVALHELGHALGLDHSQYDWAVMYAYIDPGEVQRVLSSDDIDGVMAIYNTGPVTPVVLAYFGAALAEEGVLLSWRTASEIESYGWMVQRSQNALDYQDVSPLISGYGRSEEPHDYSFTDLSAKAGQVYNYRLQQISVGGAVTYSEPVTIAVSNAAVPDLHLQQNYPNPFNPETVISYTLPEAAEVHLSIYSAAGRLVQELVQGVQQAGLHRVTWRAEGLPSGAYLYRLQVGEHSFTKALTLIK